MTDVIDPIAHLDFTPGPPQCECCSARCEHHPAGVRCAHTAMFHTKVHAFGFCRNPGLDHGFAVHIVCAHCMSRHARIAEDLVAASHRTREMRGIYLSCLSCNTQIINVHEVWEARELSDVL